MAMLRLGRTRSQAALHCSFDRRDSRRIRRDRPSVGQQQQQQQQRMARLRGKGGESTETRERQSDRTEIAERRLRVCMRLQLRSVSTLLLLRPQFRSVASHAPRFCLWLCLLPTLSCRPKWVPVREIPDVTQPTSGGQTAPARLCLTKVTPSAPVTPACLLSVSLLGPRSRARSVNSRRLASRTYGRPTHIRLHSQIHVGLGISFHRVCMVLPREAMRSRAVPSLVLVQCDLEAWRTRLCLRRRWPCRSHGPLRNATMRSSTRRCSSSTAP